jgi:hypothetical protein
MTNGAEFGHFHEGILDPTCEFNLGRGLRALVPVYGQGILCVARQNGKTLLSILLRKDH